MKPLSIILLCLSGLPWIACGADSPVFLEADGILVMEAESTASSLRKWKEKTDVEGFTGECHLEFTGNKPEMGPPASPLSYSFKVATAGNYRLVIRARKRLVSKREDICNDCYVRLDGNFESGNETPLKVLKEDTKMFGGDADGWGYALKLDVKHKKFLPVYALKSGETYELVISGRSQNYNIDRILLVHESADLASEDEQSGGERAGVDIR